MPTTSDRLKAAFTHRYAVERELGSGGMATVYGGETMPYSVRQFLATAGLALLACGDGTPFSPTVETVAGSYQATSLTATENGITADLLLLGASLSVVLNQDGTTTGRLLAPGLGENGADVDEDLAGTWTLEGSTVTFDQPGDTFVRDVPFTAERNRLSAEGTFGGVIVRAVLTK